MTWTRPGRTNLLLITAVLVAATATGCDSGSAGQVTRPMPSVAIDQAPVTYSFAQRTDGPAPADFGGPTTVRISDADFQKPGFVIRDGAMLFRPRGVGSTAAYFTSGDFGGLRVTQVGAQFVFIPRGGTPGTLAILVSRESLRPPFGVHLVITPTTWNVGVWAPEQTGAGLIVLDGGTFATPLAQDGVTDHSVEVTVDGPQARIDLPDGQTVAICDERIARWAGSYATYETLTERSATDSLVAFTGISARPTARPSTSQRCGG